MLEWKDQKDQKLNLRWNVINYTWLVKESQEKGKYLFKLGNFQRF